MKIHILVGEIRGDEMYHIINAYKNEETAKYYKDIGNENGENGKFLYDVISVELNEE